MRLIFRIIMGVVVMLGWMPFASAQDVRVRVSGLENDSVYLSLLSQERELKHREDSLRQTVRLERERLIADTTDLYTRSRQILQTEEAIFEIRKQSGIIANRINNIEQEFILDNLMHSGSAGTTASTPADNEPNLTDNSYFRENLTADEYAELKAGESLQPRLDSLLDGYTDGYEQLRTLASAYENSEKRAVSDSLHAAFRNAAARLGRIEKEFAAIWKTRYDQEIYLYSYLLDRLNRMDELSALNEKGKTMRHGGSDESMSAVLADYPAQRALLTEYQLALSRALGLSAASDSLGRAAAPKNTAFPKIEIAEREYVRFEEIAFLSDADPERPPVEFTPPESGIVYSVMVGVFSRRQAASVFRRAVPVLCERLSGDQWRYYVGLFRSYGDAAEAAQALKEKGFRRPEPVRWKEGVFENLVSQITRNEGLWRIAVTTADGELSADARLQINRHARSKEITRAGNTFYIGVFTNMLHVEDVVRSLENFDEITVAVEKLEE